MEEKMVRGSILNGFFKFIKRSWGDQGLDEFRGYSNIDPERIKMKEWYSAEILSDIHRWLGEVKGKEYVRRAGRYTVQDLGLLSYLVQFASIETLLKKAPKSYNDAFSYGKALIKIEENQAVVKMKNVVIDDYTCDAWRGVFEGTLKATKTKGKVEIYEDETKGENDCYFLMTW